MNPLFRIHHRPTNTHTAHRLLLLQLDAITMLQSSYIYVHHHPPTSTAHRELLILHTTLLLQNMSTIATNNNTGFRILLLLFCYTVQTSYIHFSSDTATIAVDATQCNTPLISTLQLLALAAHQLLLELSSMCCC